MNLVATSGTYGGTWKVTNKITKKYDMFLQTKAFQEHLFLKLIEK